MTELLNQTFGVEVEMYNINRARAAAVVAATLTRLTGDHYTVQGPGWHLDERKIYPDEECWVDTLHTVWKIESDSSIAARCDAEKTELVSPVLTWEQMPILQEVIRDLRKAGARSDPAHSCGVHVHVGGEGHTARSLHNLANMMAAHELLLIGSVGIAPSRMHWCAPVNAVFLDNLNKKNPSTMDALKECWYESHGCSGRTHYDHSRYHMLNLHSFFEGHGVEFRLFQFDSPTAQRRGGLHAGQLKSYVQLCLAMNYRALNSRRASYKPLESENQRYTMRCWLLRLGFIGDEFSTARKVFIDRLPGDSAFRHGRNAA